MLTKTGSRFLVSIVRNAIQKRSISVQSGPPTKKVPQSEVYLMGAAIAIIPMIYPMYVLHHLREIRDAAFGK